MGASEFRDAKLLDLGQYSFEVSTYRPDFEGLVW